MSEVSSGRNQETARLRVLRQIKLIITAPSPA